MAQLKNQSAKPKENKKRPAGAPAPKPIRDEEVLTLAEAAAYLRVTESDVLQAVREQALPARLFGSEWRFLKPALKDWLSVLARPNKGFLAHIGAIQDDPYLEEMLQEIYKRRGRPETEAD